MDNNKLTLYSNYNVEIAESEDKTYLDCTFVLCDFNYNKNNVMLDKTETPKYLDTLLNMPIVGKVYEYDGEADFGSHEAKKKYEYKDGKLTSRLIFGTSAYGSFYDCFIDTIQDENGNDIEVIKGRCKIWKRFEQVCEIILKRVADGIPLKTSWEILINESHQESIDGKSITVVTDFRFLSLAILGKKISPAYDISGMLECASEEYVDELAVAMEINKIETEREESIQSDNESVENKLNENEGGIVDMAENKIKTEISSLNTADLRSKVTSAIYATEGNNRYYYGVIVYPYDYVAYAQLDTQDSVSDDYTKFTFIVNSDDTISLTAQEDVKMVFIPKVENDTQIAELQGKIDEVNVTLSEKETELSQKIDEIVSLGGQIQSQKELIAEKDSIISQLEPIKAQMEQAEAEKKEAEIAEQKENLKKMAISSKYFTQEDVETSEELKQAIEELDEKQVKCLIAERVVEQASKEVVQTEEKVETSEKAEIEVSTDLNAEQEYDYSKTGNVMMDALKSKKKRRR